MSRIVFHNSPYPPLILRGGEWSEAQLQLDATFSSWNSQATDPFAIASMTLAGLVGRVARVGILSAFSNVGANNHLPLRFVSHLGSLGAEASAFTFLQGGHFTSHFINFATFRLMGTLTPVHNPLLQFFSQSTAMVAGHQMAAGLGLEEKSAQNLAEQFFQASINSLQMGVSSLLVSRITGGKIGSLEKQLEQNNRFRSVFSTQQSLAIFANSKARGGSNAFQVHSRANAIQVLARTAITNPESLRQLFDFTSSSHPHPEERLMAEYSLENLNPQHWLNLAKEGQLEACSLLLRLAEARNRRASQAIIEVDLSLLVADYYSHLPASANYGYYENYRYKNYDTCLRAALQGAKGMEEFLEATNFFSESNPRTLRNLKILRHPMAKTLECIHDLSQRYPEMGKSIFQQFRNLRLEDFPALQEAFYHSPDTFWVLYSLLRKMKNQDFERHLAKCNIETLSKQIPVSREFSQALVYLYADYRDPRSIPLLAQRTGNGDYQAALFLLEFAREGKSEAIQLAKSSSLQKVLHHANQVQDENLNYELFEYAIYGNPDALLWLQRLSRPSYYMARMIRLLRLVRT